ncbi:succinylglutamate desuccinylase/aspartoacylase family protein [Bradyrhizobium barranii]|uniref:succinylglutamate desuccinylase/aspartoacylase family protein n=1 Tax=Bradyrhizobium TaxID=374 RepID=UPI0024B147D6|nr:succinylglutamate desuccinylase/aspartoacylase family protein [Bradyrhizobium barranii]WFT97128.1 succinylglutamate desuccinylase/aspartoacylase family protein [Bradyrhizobium barranii]
MKSRVWSKIDFSATGMQADYARVPYSSDISAYGWIPVPILCFNGGSGPTALLTAGTHGDEYEGQIALRNLARELSSSANLRGRIIILPALNWPAVSAGRRNSPLDGGNLNREFPGHANGGPTAMIAHYVTSELFPLADVVLDLHSGGRSLDYLPVALARSGRNDAEAAAILRLLKSFDAPFGAITHGAGAGAGSTLYAAAEQHGIPALTTELGFGATLSERGLRIAERGLRRVLHDYEILPAMDRIEPSSSVILKYQSPHNSIYAPCDGLFEPFAKPADEVKANQPAGRVYPLGDVAAEPAELKFPASGVVAYRRFPTLAHTGDALFGLMSLMEDVA